MKGRGDTLIGHKVFILGIDGGTLGLVRQWVKMGKLPTFSAIMENGCYGDLMSTIQPISAASWSSYITGKNPGKHGIPDFVKVTPFSYDVHFVNASKRSGKSLWRILSEHGKTVGVMNVPVTFPPEEVNGFLIAGMLSPGLGSNFTYPENLAKEIKANVGEYIIDVDVANIAGKDKRDVFLEKSMAMIERRRSSMFFLYDKYQPDFFCSAITATDRVSHNFWKYMDDDTPQEIPAFERRKYGNAIFDVYVQIDTILQEILSRLDDDSTLFVISDHGFGPVHKTVSVHRWLERQGLMRRKTGRFGIGKVADNFIRKVQEVMPVGLKGVVKRWLPGAANMAASRVSYSGIEWEQTTAYPVGHFSDIFINVRGRQPDGIVEPGREYEDLRELITEKLLSEFIDPDTGENVVARVYKREELYHGKYLEEMPDLVIGWRGYKYLRMFNYPPADDDAIIWTIPPTRSLLWDRTGGHRPEGIFLAIGPNIKSGLEIKKPDITDIAPTVLYQMGVPIPGDMDGKVLTEIFAEEYLNQNPPQIESVGDAEDGGGYSFSADDSKKVEERLKGLGYLE